jgi:geranyltranstransferase
MNINEVVKENKVIVEKHLKEIMDINLKYSQKIVDSMSYSLLSGGKRLRPCLFIETLKMFNLDYRKYLDVACALEMIHTYSLIHDDLPAMDNDDLRRGNPTNHKVFGEDIAILAGDSLLNLAYEILFKFILENNKQNNIIACKNISNSAGIFGMIGGQVSDVLNENKDITLGNLEYIHENKTAKLLLASMLSASYIACASDDEIEIIKKYAFSIGMAFQISDDILDVIGDEKKLGKSIGKDEKSGKNTYTKYFGIEDSKLKLDNYIKLAKENILKLNGKNTEFFVCLADYIRNREF